MQSTVVILSGPSGVGKTTVWDQVHIHHSDRTEKIVTTTSRTIRPGEVHGKHYYFLDRPEFEKCVSSDQMLEYALVHGNYYGSTVSELERIVSIGKIPVYIVDPQGMVHLKPLLERRGYSVKTVFILPPSIDELKSRLLGRGTENEETLSLRLANALSEMEEQDFYDHRIVNTDLNDTVQQFMQIVLS